VSALYIIIGIIVAAGIGIGIYFIVKNSSKSSGGGTTTTAAASFEITAGTIENK
jgi:hypothetical protein